ncbi:MAG: hypothetical protein R3F60_12950 [bacterium]
MSTPGLIVEIEDDAIDSADIWRLQQLLSPKTLERKGIPVEYSPLGTLATVDVDLAPVLKMVATVIAGRTGFDVSHVERLHLRDCTAGQGHRLRRGDHPHEGRWLVATAALYLDACEGGRTLFPAVGEAVEPRPGRLAMWLNLDADGKPATSAIHEMEAVRRGRRRAIFWYAYCSATETATAVRDAPEGSLLRRLGHVEPAHWPRPRTLHLVVEPELPPEIPRLLTEAADGRRLAVRIWHGDDLVNTPVPPGDLLYCPATSEAARRVERRLWQPGVISFHQQAHGPFSEVSDQLTLFATVGLPVPRTEVLSRPDSARLRTVVERLGGLPVVVKMAGGEGGQGVMRLDTFASLQSVLEGLYARGGTPELQAYVADAVHWRLVVVGDQVVAAYRNVQREDDFRTYASDDPADYRLPPPPGAKTVAIGAARMLQVGLAGVDVLAHPSGRLYLLEANFPCYFPQAQLRGGIDVAGAMLDWLLVQAAGREASA